MTAINFRQRRQLLLGGAACVGTSYLPMRAFAQDYPGAAIRIVVPTAPGGLNDPVTQFLTNQFQKTWGQAAIMDHRAGAGGAIGTQLVAKAPPDGHTLLLGNIGPQAIGPALNPNVPYNTKRDLVAVGSLIQFTNVLTVSPKLQVSSVADLIEMARRNPGKVNFASSGIGQSNHLCGEIFKREAGIDITHVPYKGTGPAITDLIAGEVQLMFVNLPAAMSFIKSGRLRPLAVTSAQRSPYLPELPPVAEAARLPNFSVNSWSCLFAPSATPKAVVDRLNAECARAWNSPVGQAALQANYLDLGPTGQAETVAFVDREAAFWGKFIREAGIKGE